MSASERSMRILGVALPDVSDWREPLPAGKWSQFFGALAARLSLIDVIQPRPTTLERRLNLARNVRPGRAQWLARAGFNPRHLAAVNASLEQQLVAHAGAYDLIVQLQTLCMPRSPTVTQPYVIYTDNTMALTQRVYPNFAPLPRQMLRDWLEFEADVCRRAEAVFTFSEFARESVIGDYGVSPERVYAVGAGANQLVESVEGKSYGRPRALFVGRPFEPKGGRILLEAWRLVRGQLPEAELVIAGPRRDPVPRGEPGVRFLGRIGRAELGRQYSQASVFVLPSMFDAWGHVFIEAMGHGLPCIGTDCCAMPEIIEDAVTGLLVPRGEPEPLADALLSLLADPARAARMGRAGHARALDRFRWSQVAERVTERLTVV
jgi:glycosyltransferase involved in cell wall biosynthesis